MSKKKLLSLTAAAVLFFFAVSCSFSFLLAKEIQSRNFEESAKRRYEKLNQIVGSAADFEQLKYDLIPFSQGYPAAFCLVDSDGTVIAKSAPMISVDYFYTPEKSFLIDMEEYMTDEITEKLNSFVDQYRGSPLYLSSLSVCRKDGKYIPVKGTFEKSRSTGQEKTDIVFTDEKPELEVKKTDVCPIRLYGVQLGTDKVYKKYDELVKSSANAFAADFRNAHPEFVEGGSGIVDGGLFQHHEYFIKNGKKLCLYFDSRFDMNYDAFKSSVFRMTAADTAIAFFVLSFILFAVISAIYAKRERLEKSRRAFISAAAHELKTPLAIIANKSECILEDTSPQLNKEYVNSIYDESKRMSRMVKTLLQYSRLTSEKKIEKKKELLSPIVEEKINGYLPLIEAKNIKLVKILDENAALVCSGELIGAAVENLLSNAVKFTPEGGEIKITASGAGFEIFNSGSRISDEDAPHIWEELYSGDKARTRTDDSTGMGLAVCRLIFELHGLDHGFRNVKDGVAFYFGKGYCF